MSRSPKRKSKSARTGPRRRPDPDAVGMPSLTPTFDTALRTARGLHAAQKPH